MRRGNPISLNDLSGHTPPWRSGQGASRAGTSASLTPGRAVTHNPRCDSYLAQHSRDERPVRKANLEATITLLHGGRIVMRCNRTRGAGRPRRCFGVGAERARRIPSCHPDKSLRARRLDHRSDLLNRGFPRDSCAFRCGEQFARRPDSRQPPVPQWCEVISGGLSRVQEEARTL
jgi:hypothetical protein